MTKPPEIIDAEQPAAIREIKALNANNLKVAEAARVIFSVVLDPGVELGDAMLPDFWANAASKLHPRALIEIEPVNGAWLALLRVIETGPEHARVALVWRTDFPAAAPTVDELPRGHDVVFLGARRLWAVLRGTQILRHSFSSKASAIEWLIATTRG